MLHSIAGQKVFYFHTFVGQNPRTITKICLFFYISISNVASKSAQSAGKIVEEAGQEINAMGVVGVCGE